MKVFRTTGIIFMILSFCWCQIARAETTNLKEIAFSYFHPTKAPLSGIQSRGFMETGLIPIYPSTAKCPKVTSFFERENRGRISLRTSDEDH